MNNEPFYTVGDVVNGDYDLNQYHTFEEAKEAYNECVEEWLEYEKEKGEDASEQAMTLEEVKNFYYIKKVTVVLNVTEEIIRGGTYRKEI